MNRRGEEKRREGEEKERRRGGGEGDDEKRGGLKERKGYVGVENVMGEKGEGVQQIGT